VGCDASDPRAIHPIKRRHVNHNPAIGLSKKNKQIASPRKTQGVYLMKSPKILAIAAAIVAFPVFLHAQSRDVQSTSISQGTDTTADTASAGQQEAMLMVPAQGALLQTIDAGKVGSGNEFKVKVVGKVRLNNGTELPSGTVLVGTITKDNQQANESRLAVRFTQANLKDGGVVPIKATIVGVAKPSIEDLEGYSVTPGDQAPNEWNNKILRVEQSNVVPHVDFRSDIASEDSGVFVAAGNHNFKLSEGSEIELAIAPGNGN
jgi:hypothetical protein